MNLLCKRHNLLFIHCISTIYAFKNIKNRSHYTIYTFKNYFTTVFLIFNFSKNKFDPNGPYMYIKLIACFIRQKKFLVLTFHHNHFSQ